MKRGPVAIYGGKLRVAMKECRRCHKVKSTVTAFRRHKYVTKDGRATEHIDSWCAKCHDAVEKADPGRAARTKAYYQKNKARLLVLYRTGERRRAYGKLGRTIADYDRMYAEQGGRCEICADWFERLIMDHNHQTGRVRALLCRNCNVALGLIKEDSLTAMAMGAYIQRFRRRQEAA